MADEFKLDEATIEAIAAPVAAVLAEAREAPRDQLMTAAEVAKWSGVERTWVYEHARELGVIWLGAGPRPRLRFDRTKLQEYLARKPSIEEPVPAAKVGRRQGSWPEPGRILQSRPRRIVRKDR